MTRPAGTPLPASGRRLTDAQVLTTALVAVDGSGVGLYMVQKLVENEGGELEVVSQVGQGATFTVHFPH